MYNIFDIGSSFLSLPPNLQTKERECLFYAFDRQIAKLYRLAERLTVWSDLDKVPPKYYDIMAASIQAPYYRSNLDDKTKLALIKSAMLSYRYAGSRVAVEEMLSNVFKKAEFTPWYEYGGKPYRFRIEGYSKPTEESVAMLRRVLRKVKAARSILERFRVNLEGSLDGPDLMDGSPHGEIDGVRIEYLVIYYGDFLIQEGLRIDKLLIQARMDFWDTRRHNGRYLHDGSARHRIWRRYDIVLHFGSLIGTIHTQTQFKLILAAFRAKWGISEEMSPGGTRNSMEMLFWYDYDPQNPDGIIIHDGNHKHGGKLHHDGIIERDGVYRHKKELSLRRQKRRYGISGLIGLLGYKIVTTQDMDFHKMRVGTGLRMEEKLGVSVEFRTALCFWNILYHDGARLHDGTCLHDNVRWKAAAMVRFSTGMDFWNTRRHDGLYLHDGLVAHRAWRRYDIGAGVGFLLETRNEETQQAKTGFHTGMNFWNTAYRDGGFLHNGDLAHQLRRRYLATRMAFHSSMSSEEEIGEASVLTRTRGQYFHDGSYTRNGTARHRTVYRKELLA